MDKTVIELKGRIDSTNASACEQEFLDKLSGKEVSALVLDASALEYISSAGLRVILRLKKTYPDLTIENVGSDVYETLEMTGFTEMMTIKKAYRVVSVEGCEVIGEGANGKVYRIDKDNVVKTYKNADALSEIQREREVARLALILGVPTAISYDVVRVGDSYGSVFELLNAKSFAKLLATEPDRFDFCVDEYAKMLRKIHSIVVPDGKLPSIKAKTIEKIERIQDVLPEDLGKKLLEMTKAIPDSDHLIHGDCHTKNIVLADGEVLLIDMDTLSVGHPIFELEHMFNSYLGFSAYDPSIVEKFQGFSAEIAQKFWHASLAAYLGTTDENKISEVEDKVKCLSYAYLVDWKRRHADFSDATDKATYDLYLSRLLEILPKVDSLDFELPCADKSDDKAMEVPAEVDNLDKITEFIDGELEAAGISAKTKMQIQLAVEEIFVNIANYAYAPEKGIARVSVKLDDTPRAVEIKFIDGGTPYDPLKKEDPDVTLSAEERDIGGLGIFMTKKIMDDVKYEYKDGKNILTLKKFF